MASMNTSDLPMPNGRCRNWKRDHDAERIICEETSAKIISRRWLPIASIDMDEAVAKNTRLGGGRQSNRMPQYHERMKAGDIFPEVVTVVRSHERYGMMGGTTRTSVAIDLKDEYILAIVLAPMSPRDETAVRYLLNFFHGEPESADSGIRIAVREILDSGDKLSLKDAAAVYRINYNTLRDAVAAQKIRDKAKEFGVDLSSRSWEFLAPIKHSSRLVEESLIRGLEALPKIKREPWKALAKAAKSKGTDAEVVCEVRRLVEEEKKTCEAKKKGRAAPVLSNAAWRACRLIREAAVAFDGLTIHDVAPDNRPSLRENFAILSDRVMRILLSDGGMVA